MHGNRAMLWVAGVLLALAVAGSPQNAAAQAQGRQQEQVQRQETQPLNNAPVWRDVRSGTPGPYTTTQVKGVDTRVLVETGGEIWRQVRNGPVTFYGGWLLVVVFLGLAGFYAAKGSMKLHEKPTGRKIPRFSSWQRILHWTTATSFVILAVTGLIVLFGKHVLLPVTGYTIFSWLAQLSKNLHNFVGPLFAVCTLFMIVTFIKDNIWRAYDWVWVRKFGGFLSGNDVPSGKFNAGEKGWFWLGVLVLGITVSATGLILDFADIATGRVMIQQTHVIHSAAALLFMSGALGHIYLGTLGVEGAYDAMRTGEVDETWAKEHHQYWYEEVKGQTRGAAGGAPSAQPASPMKEGWK